MQVAEKAALRAGRSVLVNDMDTSTVMDYLVAGGIFYDDDEDKVNAEKSRADKNRLLLKILTSTRNKQNSFDVLVRSLKDAGQGNLANMLLDKVQSPKLSGTRPDSASNVGRKLISFGVPVMPEYFVRRKDLVEKIQTALLKIPEKGGWVLIHGMGGSGKTMLAASVLHDSRILEKFNTVIWLPLGQLGQDHEKLLLKFKLLIQKLDDSTSMPTLNNLEVALNLLRDKLLDRSDSVLIVLDDAWNDVVKYFNNCGGAFLVTSRKRDALDRVGGFKETVEIETGFTFPQAEDIFLQVLNLSKEELPKEAYEIWRACEGSPLAIIMIASLLQHKRNRWEFYLKKLQERPDQIKQRSEYSYDSLDAVLRVSFDDLDPNLRDHYLKLAAFPKGTPLSADVLAVLWDTEELEDAEDLMNELLNLSLAREEWSEEKERYFYIIHDLQMTFLQREDKDNKSHTCLVEAYRKRYKSWDRVPDDNYFLWYIGYHLHEAGLTEELVKCFTDLKFVAAKLRVTGAWDIIHDYNRYQNVFKKHNKLEDMESFKEFLQKNSFALSAGEQGQVVDVAQLGLCDPPERSVFPQALSMAKLEAKPYWQWTNGKMAKSRCYKKHSIKWSTPLTDLSVSPDGTRLLIGREDGYVTLLCGNTFEKLEQIEVDSQSGVGGLGFSSDGDSCVVSTDNAIYQCSIPHCRSRRPSLPDHQHRFRDLNDITQSLERLSLETKVNRVTKLEATAISEYVLSCCTVAKDTAYIGTHSGTVLSVNLRPFTLRGERNSHKEAITGLAVSSDGRFVTSASSDRSVLVYDLDEMEVRARKRFDAAVQDCLLTHVNNPEELEVVSATSRVITTWRISDEEEVGDPIRSQVRDADFRVLALSKDNRLLAAGMSNSVTKLWDFATKTELFELPAVSGTASALHFTDSTDRLFSVDNNGVLVVWEVTATTTLLDNAGSNLVMAPRFAVEWAPSGGLIASQDSRSRHLICVRDLEEPVHEKVTVEPVPFTIETVALSPDGSRFAVGSDEGHLQEWQRADSNPCTPSRCLVDLRAPSAVKCLRYLRKDGLLAAGLSDGGIWLVKDGQHRVLEAHSDKVSCLIELSQPSRLLSTSRDGSIRLWNLDVDEGGGDLETSSSLPGHNDSIISADVSKDQRWLIIGCVDAKAKVWDLEGRTPNTEVSHDYQCVRSARFCPYQNNLIATGDDGGLVRVWEVGASKPRVVDLRCPLDQQQWVVDLEWLSKDLLVSLCGVLCVWAVGTSQLLHSFYPRGSCFLEVRANPEGEGQRMVAVDSSGTLYLFKRV